MLRRTKSLSCYQSHLGEKLNGIKGRPIRCFTRQLETTNIYLQPETLNSIITGNSAYVLCVTATTHHKQQLLGPLHMFQELVAHAFV